MVMDKFKTRSRTVIAGLRAEVNYQIAVKVNLVAKECLELKTKLMDLKDIIAWDMKKWSKQRSDM